MVEKAKAKPKGGARTGSGAKKKKEETPGIKSESVSEPVGVTPDPPELVPEPDTYVCINCKGAISKGDAKCAVCEVSLDWAGVA